MTFEIGTVYSQHSNLSARLNAAVAIVTITAMSLVLVGLFVDYRIGLLGVALVLGWTQFVGL